MLPDFRLVSRVSLPIIATGAWLLLSIHLLGQATENQPAPPESATAITPDGTPTATAERVLVTGSNIPTAAEVGPNPVQTIDRYAIERSGERNTEELLRNQPVANANGVPASGQPGTLYGQGASSISLRGFDPGATLVLIDGRRMVNHPSGTSGGTQFFVDLNTIPKAAIDSIEILKDGASTTYGADAVAGVVNIKLRRNYTGGEAFAEYGNSTDTDSGERSASFLFGLGDNDTNFTGVINYYGRNSIFNRDRDYDRQTPLSRRTTNSEPYNLELSRAAVLAAGGNPPAGLGDTFFGRAPFFSTGTAPASSYVYFPDADDPAAAHFPINHFQGELPDTSRWGMFISGDHKLCGDQVVVYADLFFQRANVHNEQAPENTGSFQLQGSIPIGIPPHAPGTTLGGPTYAETGVPLGAFNPFNPFQQIISGDSRARLFEFGNRKFDNDTSAWFTSVGVKGDKLFDGNWGYDASFRFSHIDSTIDFTFPSTTRFNRILNAADPIFDPSSPNFIGTTTPFNPFGDFRRPIPNNYLFREFVLIHPEELDSSRLYVFDLNVYSTSLFDLPAGGVGLAFGGQFQDESLAGQVPHNLEIGDVRPIQIVSVFGSRYSAAGYSEMSIPVFGGNVSMPGFHALDFSIAGRYESFSNGSNVMVPKLGMRWQPFDDSLTLRATWGEGYRLPTLVEVNSPPIAGAAQNVFDPVKKIFISDLPAIFLPNPDLQPEDSRNFTAGAVYSPKFIPGLTAAIDLFNIETTGWINPGPSITEAITRIESGNGSPGEFVKRDANGNLVSVSFVSFENSGTQKARGADFALGYEIQSVYGTFRANTQATYLDSFQFSSFPGQKERELRSSPNDLFSGQISDDAYLKWKAISRLEWLWRGFDTIFTVRYYDGFHEIVNFGPQFPNNIKEHWVKQEWLFDVQISYTFGKLAEAKIPAIPADPKRVAGSQNQTEAKAFGWTAALATTTLTVGVNNLFDHDPPRSIDNFPRFIYDPTGRFVYVSATKKFW